VVLVVLELPAVLVVLVEQVLVALVVRVLY
jgi:hypothetical protein